MFATEQARDQLPTGNSTGVMECWERGWLTTHSRWFISWFQKTSPLNQACPGDVTPRHGAVDRDVTAPITRGLVWPM